MRTAIGTHGAEGAIVGSAAQGGEWHREPGEPGRDGLMRSRPDSSSGFSVWASDTRRPALRVGVGMLLLLLLPGVRFAGAAELSIVVLTPTPVDNRIGPSREAIAFWNDRLAELGLKTRLAEPRVVVESPVARALENYGRQVAQRSVRLPAGPFEPAPPEVLTNFDADIVVLLSRQDIMSFTWPMPRVSPPRHFVVVRSVRGPYRHDAMVSRHVVAHELGHALGLDHNAEPHTLMCGPCQPLTSEPDATGFLPLTTGDRARLVELHSGW
jgi:hypothetical protein